MSETKQFFIDVVNSMPLDSEWFFQAPDQEFFDAIEGIPFEYEPDKVFVKITLKEEYRKKIADLSVNDVYGFIQEARVFRKGRKIFEAYDGFVIGTVSRHFDITGTPLMNHLNQDILFISSEW